VTKTVPPRSVPTRAAKRPSAQRDSVAGQKTQATAATSAPPESPPFPIVAIGASAGGLEALEQFFSHLPAGSGLAFVVIQHLDPDHKAMLPELLQRATAMPVAQARSRMKLKPECV
jgi:two-component system, chemotaxis family, CheB/CheR fusion protein